MYLCETITGGGTRNERVGFRTKNRKKKKSFFLLLVLLLTVTEKRNRPNVPIDNNLYAIPADAP